jgi:hypothetical protein
VRMAMASCRLNLGSHLATCVQRQTAPHETTAKQHNVSSWARTAVRLPVLVRRGALHMSYMRVPPMGR